MTILRTLKEKTNLILASFLSLALITTPGIAFAASGTEGGGTGGWGGSASGMYRWSNWTSTGSFNIDSVQKETPYLPNYLAPSAGGSYGYKPFDSGTYGSDTYFAACVTYQGNGAINTKGGYVSDGHGANFNIRGNWAGERLNDFFWNNRDKTNDNVELANFNSGESGWGYYYKTNGTDMKAIWIDSEKLYVPHVFAVPGLKVVKYENSSDPYDEPNEFDYLGNSAEWKYYNAPTEGKYRGITPPTGSQSHNYSNTVKVTVQRVYKVITIVCKNSDAPSDAASADSAVSSGNTGEYKSVSISYRTDPPFTMEKEITYTGNTPDNSQIKFNPLNLNRNNYAKAGDNDLPASFVSDDEKYRLEASVDNNQNITDNSDLSALDINNDTDFDVNFHNNSYGLHSRFDWFTVPRDLQNNSWEYSGSSYANGRNGDYEDVTDGGAVGYYRFNLKTDFSISSDDLASLIFNEEEKVGSDSFIFSTDNDPSYSFPGGEFIARFILNGKYNTDNESDNNFKEWWVADYQQERFYEYGVEYKGTFNTAMISNPSLVAPTSSPSPSLSGAHFSTDGLNQRGLYVGKVSILHTQPIMCGNWDVRTIAGDLR